MTKPSTKRAQSIVGFGHLTRLLIFTEKRITHCMLPHGIPYSWFFKSESMDPVEVTTLMGRIAIVIITLTAHGFQLASCRPTKINLAVTQYRTRTTIKQVGINILICLLLDQWPITSWEWTRLHAYHRMFQCTISLLVQRLGKSHFRSCYATLINDQTQQFN